MSDFPSGSIVRPTKVSIAVSTGSAGIRGWGWGPGSRGSGEIRVAVPVGGAVVSGDGAVEDRAALGVGFDPDVAVHGVEQLADDPQADAEAGGVGLAAVAEAVEQLWEAFGGDAGTSVGHGDPDHAGRGA